jgi:hypothetical protein
MGQLPMKDKEPPHTTRSVLKQHALEDWENEGGGIPNIPTPRPGEMLGATGPRRKPIVFDLNGTPAESKSALHAEETQRVRGTILTS